MVTEHKNIALVSGLEFSNVDFVRSLVRAIPVSRYRLVITSGCLPCRVAFLEAQKCSVLCMRLLWKCKPHRLVPLCGTFVLLYDGGNYWPLSRLMTYAAKWAPQTIFRIYGPDGPIENSVAFLHRSRDTVASPRREYGPNYEGVLSR
jgi:hypothetical protein